MRNAEQLASDIAALATLPDAERVMAYNRLTRALRDMVRTVAGVGDDPILSVQLVPIEKVVANDYNPNSVAQPEMELLAQSIRQDGVTQPVVTCPAPMSDCWLIVDGFHRNKVIRGTMGRRYMPIAEIDKDIKDRMASTVRHNRARGKHKVDMMSVLVERLLRLGRTDLEIAEQLGMEAEEVIRLKQLTGLAGLFKGQGYSRAWVRPEGLDLARQGTEDSVK